MTPRVLARLISADVESAQCTRCSALLFIDCALVQNMPWREFDASLSHPEASRRPLTGVFSVFVRVGATLRGA